MRNRQHKTDLLSQLLPYDTSSDERDRNTARDVVHKLSTDRDEENMFLQMLGLS